MNKKPVTKTTVIIFGIGSIIWTIYATLEVLFGEPDLLRLLRLVVAAFWVMGFFSMSIRYRKQKQAEAEQDKNKL